MSVADQETPAEAGAPRACAPGAVPRPDIVVAPGSGPAAP